MGKMWVKKRRLQYNTPPTIHVTNDFTYISNLIELSFIVIPCLTIRSLQHFSHATTVQQKFVAINLLPWLTIQLRAKRIFHWIWNTRKTPWHGPSEWATQSVTSLLIKHRSGCTPQMNRCAQVSNVHLQQRRYFYIRACHPAAIAGLLSWYPLLQSNSFENWALRWNLRVSHL